MQKIVAILVDTASDWGRKVVAGINAYSRLNPQWEIYLETRGQEEFMRLPTGWKGDGIIARVANPEMRDYLLDLQLPVVNVSGIDVPGQSFPRVTTDTVGLANMAATYFLERGFLNFAYVSLSHGPYVSAQYRDFGAALGKAGVGCELYEVNTDVGDEIDWGVETSALAGWLRALPKPIAVFTKDAKAARQVLYACDVGRLRVPEEIAILAAFDDDVLCEVGHIPLSGILTATDRIGHEAARLLHRMLEGRSVPKKPVLIQPTRVIERQSTDTLAIEDKALVAAQRFIRQRASEPVGVDDVAAQAGISRRELERRFKRVLGRTPAEAIRQAHIECAQRHLLETDLPIPRIAEISGFGSPEYMASVFKQSIGLSPLKYRHAVRGRRQA